MPPFKYTYEDVKRIYEVDGNKLISKQFNGVREDHEFLCGCGRNTHKMSFDNARRRGKVKCKQCRGEAFSKYATGNPNFAGDRTPKLKFKDVKKVYDDAGVELLETEFKGVTRYHKYRCSCGTVVTKSTYNNFSRGKTRCRECANKVIGEKRSKAHDDIMKDINDSILDGYTFINYDRRKDDRGYSVIFVTTDCPNGHRITQRMGHITEGKGCKPCSHDRIGKEKRMRNAEIVKKYMKKQGLEMLSDYVDSKTHIVYKCDCENRTVVYSQNIAHIKAGLRCGCRYKFGEDHHSWNPNLPERLRQQKRDSLDYFTLFKRSVSKRDGDKCARCDKEESIFHCHHIWSTTRFPKLRLEKANCITLCRRCHQDLHSTRHYGSRNFKPQDSYEYIPNLHKFTGYTYEEAKSLFIKKGLLSPDSE